ncbi:MAG: hypothetical protein M3N49_12030 [Candidatus Eremiobacteraeota bacterium]|nr:hypothetical protein [Candidatus Eremiobacteraeota bacterium]
MKTIASIALAAVLAGCSGGGSTVTSSPSSAVAPAAAVRAPLSGGPGTTTLTYYDTHADVGPCEPHELTIMNGYAPAENLSFPAGQGPPLTVSLCNFQTPQYVRVTLDRPKYGTPFIRQTDYTVTVDAPGPAKVTATWTACGPTLPCDPGLKGTVTFTIGPPSPGGGL